MMPLIGRAIFVQNASRRCMGAMVMNGASGCSCSHWARYGKAAAGVLGMGAVPTRYQIICVIFITFCLVEAPPAIASSSSVATAMRIGSG